MIATIHGLRHRIEHDVWPVPGGNGRATSDVVVIAVHRGDRLGDRLSWARAAMRQIQPPSKPLTMLAVSRRIRAPCEKRLDLLSAVGLVWFCLGSATRVQHLSGEGQRTCYPAPNRR